MSLQEATNAAMAVREDGYFNPRCLVAYQYTRGCYAVVVEREDCTTVLVDEAAVRMYRMNRRPEEGRQRDGT